MATYIIDNSRDGFLIIQDAMTLDIYEKVFYGGLKAAPSYAPKTKAYKAWKKEFEKSMNIIREKCDPQEVYLYEYNNHECMYFDDSNALAMVRSIFGEEAAKKIKRVLRHAS